MPVVAIVLTLLMIIMVAVVIVTATVIIVVAPHIAAVIVTALVASGAGSPFNFFSIGIFIYRLYQFTDGCGPLAVQLATELLVPKPLGESGDGLGVSDVGNGISCL